MIHHVFLDYLYITEPIKLCLLELKSM
jgi:hypothetical protein